jgi:Spy/CpxP family protein refolding chaperone
MRTKKTIFISVITALALIVGATAATAGNTALVPDLDLTKEQIGKLGKIVEDFSVKKLELEARIDNKRMALAQELRKADRWDSEAKIKASSRIVNKLVKGLTSRSGDLLKLKVEYFLKAKDVFTDDQRMVILGALTEFDMDLPDSFSYYLELDLPALDLNLTNQQIKKLLKYRAEMEIRDIRYELDLRYRILDLQAELLSPKRDPKKVNKLITSMVGTGTKIIDNKVAHILRAKDVLTLEQKMALFHTMLMVAQ